MRLIDGDECIEQIKKYCVGCDNYKGIRCRACSFDYAMDVVDSMQTIYDAEIRRNTIEEFKNLLLVKYDDYIFTDEEKAVLPRKDQELISAQNKAWKTAKKKAEQIAEQMKVVRNENTNCS